MSNDPIGSIEFFVVIAAVGSVLLFRISRTEFIKKLKAKNWPIADGTITSINVSVGNDPRYQQGVCDISYSYSVNGEYYSGYYSTEFPNSDLACDFMDSVRNEKVIIRYKNSIPTESVFLVTDQSENFRAAFF